MLQNTLKQFFAQSGLPLLEAKMIAEKVMGVSRAWMIAHDTDPIASENWQSMEAMVKRRLSGEPMAYIIGHREFMSLDFHVSPAVLIPRPETEILVEEATFFLEAGKPRSVAGEKEAQQYSHPFTSPHKSSKEPILDTVPRRMLDLGTGSGAIAISIAHYLPQTEVWAGDISAEALDIAQYNAQTLNTQVHFRQGSWFEPFEGMTFDLIVSNPPYISHTDEHLQQGDLRFEPRIALTDFHDGLQFYRTIIQQAHHYLKTGGALMFEHGWDQAQAIRTLLTEHGFVDVGTVPDFLGHDRVTLGVKP